MHILMMYGAFDSFCKAGVEHGSVKGMTPDLCYPLEKFERHTSSWPQERTAINGRQKVTLMTALDAWHNRYHTVQFTALCERLGW